MTQISHLRSLQALELAVRLGSMKAAAGALAITPAAVGQRIRMLEDYLGTDLLMRGRSGLKPTPELAMALDDLGAAFSALERVTETLDFQRTAEIHIVADLDWAELWLAPRLPVFRAENPNILFCINGEGDVPMRLGAPDCRIEYGKSATGEALFTDVLVPLCTADLARRVGDFDDLETMEGLPLLHLQQHLDDPDRPGWREWFSAFGHRQTGQGRGVLYRHMRVALAAMRDDVGFLICGISLVTADLTTGHVQLPFPVAEHLVAPFPYRLRTTKLAASRPQMQRFLSWLRAEAEATSRQLRDPENMVATLTQIAAPETAGERRPTPNGDAIAHGDKT